MKKLIALTASLFYSVLCAMEIPSLDDLLQNDWIFRKSNESFSKIENLYSGVGPWLRKNPIPSDSLQCMVTQTESYPYKGNILTFYSIVEKNGLKHLLEIKDSHGSIGYREIPGFYPYLQLLNKK